MIALELAQRLGLVALAHVDGEQHGVRAFAQQVGADCPRRPARRPPVQKRPRHSARPRPLQRVQAPLTPILGLDQSFRPLPILTRPHPPVPPLPPRTIRPRHPCQNPVLASYGGGAGSDRARRPRPRARAVLSPSGNQVERWGYWCLSALLARRYAWTLLLSTSKTCARPLLCAGCDHAPPGDYVTALVREESRGHVRRHARRSSGAGACDSPTGRPAFAER